jgi:hypothetical protein
MNQKPLFPSFSKALMTGLFVGIFSTLCCFTFDIAYRSITGFPLTAYVNVSTTIFICNILLTVCGLLYSGFKNLFRNGETIFIAAFILLTLFCLWKAQSIQRSPIPELSNQFRVMLSGIIIILGINIAILMPYLNHNKRFERIVI